MPGKAKQTKALVTPERLNSPSLHDPSWIQLRWMVPSSLQVLDFGKGLRHGQGKFTVLKIQRVNPIMDVQMHGNTEQIPARRNQGSLTTEMF